MKEETPGNIGRIELFRSENLLLVYYPAERDDIVFVTFTPAQNRQPEGFGTTYFAKRQIPCLCFIATWDHWWQVAEMKVALEATGTILSRFPRIVTYGTSMGAYGALRFSRDLLATDILAVSPAVLDRHPQGAVRAPVATSCPQTRFFK